MDIKELKNIEMFSFMSHFKSCHSNYSNKIEELLYNECLLGNWQMNDSERLAMLSVLLRIKPLYGIEVGTFKGGSLSLIAQYTHHVYSIDIDPEVSKKLQRLKIMKNVTFISGDSANALPLLLSSISQSNHRLGFVLIDGDHSAEGVKRDINLVLRYKPICPMVLMFHDSFNPHCRKGILSVEWPQNPYVHFVDIDFVPGRIMENGGEGNGEMWGGLGIAYLLPIHRDNQLTIRQSASKMFDYLSSLCYKK